MKKQGCFTFALLLLISSLLSGCFSALWTGASLVYDRHNLYKKVDDYQLSATALQALYSDGLFKQPYCAIDLAVFNGDILLAGHVPSIELREEALRRLHGVTGYRRLFNQMDILAQPANSLEDSWITAKIRSQILADSTIDPNAFKVITADRIVYLMGDVRPQQAQQVITIAKTTAGVARVVKLFRYYNLSTQARADG